MLDMLTRAANTEQVHWDLYSAGSHTNTLAVPPLVLQNKTHCAPSVPSSRRLLRARSIVQTSIGGLCRRQALRPPPPAAWADTASCPLHPHDRWLLGESSTMVHAVGGVASEIPSGYAHKEGDAVCYPQWPDLQVLYILDTELVPRRTL